MNTSIYKLENTDADLDPFIERVGDAHYVLRGEASHGTSEFYTWRAEITKRLITEKGFSFRAVEGDWPDCYRVNRYIKGMVNSGSSAYEVLSYLTAVLNFLEFSQHVMRIHLDNLVSNNVMLSIYKPLYKQYRHILHLYLT